MAIDTTRQLIQQITNASSVGENTATRVGNAMEAMLNDVKAADDKANAATNRINTTEQGIANANQRLTTEEGVNAEQSAQIAGLKQDLQNIRPVTIEGDVVNNPDNVFLTSANDEITPKERTTSLSAKGHYIMRPTDNFAAKLKANYIHEIPFDVNLGGASVTIPQNAVLKFTGGKITNGKLNLNGCAIEAADDCIFDGVEFVGETYQPIRLDWLMRMKDLSITDKTDVSAELEAALNCGARCIDVTSRFYYYITRTIVISSNNVDIIGNTDFFIPNVTRQTTYMPPCIHTDKAITMLRYECNTDNGNGRKSLTLKGLYLYQAYDFTGEDYSTLSAYQKTPLLKVTNGNSGIYKVDVNVCIVAKDCECKHPTSGGNYYNSYDVLWAGIEFDAVGYPQTFITISGSVLFCYHGFLAQGDGGSGWITDITTYLQTNCALLCDAKVSPLKIYGSGQPYTRFAKAEAQELGYAYYSGTAIAEIQMRGTFWDLGSSASRPIYNSNDAETGNNYTIYNPFYEASGENIYKTNANAWTSLPSSGVFSEDVKNGYFNAFLTRMCEHYNQLCYAQYKDSPNLTENFFVGVASSGHAYDWQTAEAKRILVSDITVKEGNTILDESVFLSGSINELFVPREFWDEDWTTAGMRYKNYGLVAAHKLTIEFTLTRGTGRMGSILMARSSTALYNNISALLTFTDGTTVAKNLLGGYPALSGMINLSDISSRRGVNISSVKITITPSASQGASLSIPWIGLLGGYGSPYINGGYAGGVLSVNSLRLPHSTYGFTHLEDKNFKGFSISPADGWKEVLVYTTFTDTTLPGFSKLKYRCEDAEFEITYDVTRKTNKQLHIYSCNVKNIKAKIEVYASTVNATYVKTVKVYVKAFHANMPTLYFEPCVLSTPYASFFIDRASSTLHFATDEFGYMASGSTAERPTPFVPGDNITPGSLTLGDIGFEYFDTTLGKPIYAKAISGGVVTWVDATGGTV
jgi:hypothetical protein